MSGPRGVRHDRVGWSADELARLRELAAAGLGSAQSARKLNDEFHGGASERTATTVNLARVRYGIYVTPQGRVVREVTPQPRPEADPLEWLEKVRPIAVDAPQRPRASVTPTDGLTMVAGDFHFGSQSDTATSVFIETARQLKPATIILNGDLPDLLAVSKYPKDVRARHTWSLQDEARAMHGFLHELEAAVPRTTRIVETEANHSGNGTASRWWRYLSDHIGPLMTLPGAEERMSYQAWWYPAWTRLALVESEVVANDLLVLHGDIVRKHAAYSARTARRASRPRSGAFERSLLTQGASLRDRT